MTTATTADHWFHQPLDHKGKLLNCIHHLNRKEGEKISSLIIITITHSSKESWLLFSFWRISFGGFLGCRTLRLGLLALLPSDATNAANTEVLRAGELDRPRRLHAELGAAALGERRRAATGGDPGHVPWAGRNGLPPNTFFFFFV